MKKIVILVILPLAIIAGGLLWWTTATKPVASSDEVRNVLIKKGSSASQVGMLLEEKGVIRSALAFKIFSQINGLSAKLQAGEYEVPANSTLPQVVAILLAPPKEIWVTVPEGLRREEVVERFIAGLELTGDAADNFREQFLLLSKDKEGYLFPDTYLVPRDITPGAAINLMENTFNSRVDGEVKAGYEEQGLTFEEAVVLASLVERETKDTRTNPEERPTVAGILLKRWKRGWTLDIDAGVQYAAATNRCAAGSDCAWWPVIGRADIDETANSPYNTYKNAGIPPAPIANPGLTALKAVAYPKESDYWFYIHEDDGTIHFARTIEEHNQNIRNYLN